MASLQSNPLGEDAMQDVLGVGDDYDREGYEVSNVSTLVKNCTLLHNTQFLFVLYLSR